ncbi:MAG TPA: hypothetical protein VIL42_02160 [Sphingomicrobium sp.]|jgi:hypothetical protein
MRRLLIIGVTAVAGCSTPGGPYPSLAPRAAEAIDPRVDVVRPLNDKPVSATMAAQLAALAGQARAGDAAFAPAIAEAERLATAAGARQSESWIAAQQALSAAIAARRPTALALSDVDAIAASALISQGGIAPNDLAAIRSAAEEIAGIARRQTDRVDAVQNRLR